MKREGEKSQRMTRLGCGRSSHSQRTRNLAACKPNPILQVESFDVRLNANFHAQDTSPARPPERHSKITSQIMDFCFQSLGDFNQRIHRRRFLSALNAANENGREVSHFGQLLLAETGFFPSDSDGFAQKTAVLNGRHGALADRKPPEPTMSLTTSFEINFSCVNFVFLIKLGKMIRELWSDDHF